MSDQGTPEPLPHEAGEPVEVADSSPAPESWGGPSQEEWRTMVQAQQFAIQRLEQLAQPQYEEPEPPDYSNMNMGELVQTYVDDRFGQISPLLRQAIQQEGEKQLNAIFDQAEKDDRIGPFDRNIAGQIAEGMYQEGMDPNQVAYHAAYQAAQYAKTIREQAIEEYKSSVKKTPFSDPSVGNAGGGKKLPAPKSYDEVLERWAGQEEV